MKWNEKRAERVGWFLVGAALILLYFTILRWWQFKEMLAEVGRILQPIIFGMIFAYLLRAPVNFLEQKILNHRTSQTVRLLNSVLIVYSLVAVCFYVMGRLVWPELQENVTNVLSALPNQIDYIMGKVEQLLKDESQISGLMGRALEYSYEKVEFWIKNELWDYVNVILSVVTSGVIGTVSSIFNVIIGIIVSIYVLMERKHFASQGKKLAYAFLKPEQARVLLDTVKKMDEIFSGFIIGKIIDSIIIGLLCFICLTFLKMPYTVLVSIIVGVTNVIPFFGPYLGAIPSAFLIFLSDWRQGLVFIVFILLLQQLDGNVIGPKILGESTGLASFWVVFAILLAGGLFGVAGMIVGVPTFATLYYVVKLLVNARLEKNGTLQYVVREEKEKERKEENGIF